MAERRLYVETSVWGMIPKGQPREMRRASLQFLRNSGERIYFASEVVLKEIQRCEEVDFQQIIEVFESIRPILVEVTPEAMELAQFYIDSGILSPRKREDALHVATATFHEMDVLVSWNHRHMANKRKTEQYRGANLLRGYPETPQILTPLEVLHE